MAIFVVDILKIIDIYDNYDLLRFYFFYLSEICTLVQNTGELIKKICQFNIIGIINTKAENNGYSGYIDFRNKNLNRAR